ncbi:hypothetical protein N0V90_004472 [Kalmusia sp. IMI 367209]|nr:hypothetical protein N0V90_004472 [Kalmusia sp. IMI 367209]
MGDELHNLEQEYCPPLDPALFHALYLDFEGQENGIQALRVLLDGLKQTAISEQLTEFDASGSSGDAIRSSPSKKGSDDTESNAETWTSQTTVSDYMSLSNDVAALRLEGSPSGSDDSARGGYFRDTEGFDTQTKELLLAETFPTLRLALITYTLKKCADDFEKATDELLNHVYFENVRGSPETEAPVAKGIDAFSEEHHLPQRGKKGKRRKQKGANLYDARRVSTSESDLSQTSRTANRWKDIGKDVEFIASRTNITTKTVSSLYHENGMSLPGTLIALLKKNIATHGKEEPDALIIQPALELNDEFPNIDLEYAIALVRLSAPSTANAHELAKALTVYPSTTSLAKGGLQVIPRYAPINLSDPTPESTSLPVLAPSATPRTTASLAASRSEAFTQASAAYRKGRSNPLYKAAAGYYAQLGRDTNAHLHAQSEADADLFVSQQSTSTVLDLHGVTVESATRIARQKTKAWLDGLGEARIPGYGAGRGGARDGYRIVTGLGRHSEGGRGKLGPAVVRALVKEGWKVEVGTGELVVTGLARRK